MARTTGPPDMSATNFQPEVADLFGYQVRVLSLEALIQAKRAAGRPKDLLVIPELEALLELRQRPPE